VLQLVDPGALFTDPRLDPLDRVRLLGTGQIVVRYPALGQSHEHVNDTIMRKSREGLSSHVSVCSNRQ
jgi:hypothetical protein